jgi:hypothetical protein
MNILELIEELQLAAAKLGNRAVAVKLIVGDETHSIMDVSVNHENGTIEMEVMP